MYGYMMRVMRYRKAIVPGVLAVFRKAVGYLVVVNTGDRLLSDPIEVPNQCCEG